MVLFRTFAALTSPPVINGDGFYLRTPRTSDFRQWAELRRESREFLKPWEPTWVPNDLTPGAFRRRISHYEGQVRADAAYPFFLFGADDTLMGGMTFSNVRRGVVQATTLGYWMGERHAGRGHMTAAVRAARPFVFDTLGLHRLEAACLLDNHASIRLLEKAGFTREGLARSYLCIDGRWQDHILFGLVADDPV